MIIHTCLWSSSFIAQSYFFSQIISVKNKSAFMVPFMILATSMTFILVFTSNNSQLRQQELTTLLSVVLSFGPSGAIIVKYFYYMLPTFIRNNTYPDGSLDACDNALILGPIVWIGATILVDYRRNRIASKNVFLNDVINKDTGTLRNKKQLFKDSLQEQEMVGKDGQVRSLVKNDSIYTESEISGLNE